MLRFAILNHTVGTTPTRSANSKTPAIAAGPVHWDWLFEPPLTEPPGLVQASKPNRSMPGAALWTWATDPLLMLDALERPNIPSVSVKALRLADHRFKYLDYEGPLSNDRGTVIQLAKGFYDVTAQSDQSMSMELTLIKSKWIASDEKVALELRQSIDVSDSNRFVWTLRTSGPPPAF